MGPRAGCRTLGLVRCRFCDLRLMRLPGTQDYFHLVKSLIMKSKVATSYRRERLRHF
jgi:hypothetical protein